MWSACSIHNSVYSYVVCQWLDIFLTDLLCCVYKPGLGSFTPFCTGGFTQNTQDILLTTCRLVLKGAKLKKKNNVNVAHFSYFCLFRNICCWPFMYYNVQVTNLLFCECQVGFLAFQTNSHLKEGVKRGQNLQKTFSIALQNKLSLAKRT